MFNFMSCGRCAMLVLVLVAVTLGDAAAMPLHSSNSTITFNTNFYSYTHPVWGGNNIQFLSHGRITR
ncbi:ribosomal protein L31 [Pseudomonas marginalis]|uniref:hypothetical protein n=1 Tax=Pseudomonas marginalis TaxID=298 RepID=UPI00209C9B24|nr:hypothetical protein [Pseudomonas marginalis]MCP1509959.1 ribosomal protein L31 [Pseudomonas marginalis]MCP1521617.1 ribosomal protein L31 [Pseudomonas marginalis]MDQ0502686.1 ribosomal protein L31 [Pseudomonas marginalis]